MCHSSDSLTNARFVGLGSPHSSSASFRLLGWCSHSPTPLVQHCGPLTRRRGPTSSKGSLKARLRAARSQRAPRRLSAMPCQETADVREAPPAVESSSLMSYTSRTMIQCGIVTGCYWCSAVNNFTSDIQSTKPSTSMLLVHPKSGVLIETKGIILHPKRACGTVSVASQLARW